MENNETKGAVDHQKSEAEQKVLQDAQREQELMEDIKRRHKVDKVYMLKVPTDDSYTNFAIGFIRYPSRIDVSIAMTMRDSDPLKGKEIVLRNSWLEGDESILNNDELFLSATTVLDVIINVRQAIVKKN